MPPQKGPMTIGESPESLKYIQLLILLIFRQVQKTIACHAETGCMHVQVLIARTLVTAWCADVIACKCADRWHAYSCIGCMHVQVLMACKCQVEAACICRD